MEVMEIATLCIVPYRVRGYLSTRAEHAHELAGLYGFKQALAGTGGRHSFCNNLLRYRLNGFSDISPRT